MNTANANRSYYVEKAIQELNWSSAQAARSRTMDIRQALKSKGVIQPDQAVVPGPKALIRKATSDSGSLASFSDPTLTATKSSRTRNSTNEPSPGPRAAKEVNQQKGEGEVVETTRIPNSDGDTGPIKKSTSGPNQKVQVPVTTQDAVETGDFPTVSQTQTTPGQEKVSPRSQIHLSEGKYSPASELPHRRQHGTETWTVPNQSCNQMDGTQNGTEKVRTDSKRDKKVYWDLQQIEEKAHGIVQSVQKYYREREKTIEPDPDSNLEIWRVTERIRQYNLDICRSRVNDLLAVCEQATEPLQKRLDVLLHETAFLKENIETCCKGDDMYVTGIREALAVAGETEKETQAKLAKISATMSSLESCLATCS
jgi:hypothetical protein